MNRIILFLVAVFLNSCDDIIQEDIQGFGVVIVTPPAGYVTDSNQVSFKWEEVPYADEYHLQVASPGFDNPAFVAVDTITIISSIDLVLSPDTYQWRIRAENNISHTDYYSRSLVVLEPMDISSLFPQLISPAANHITNRDTILFQWQTLNGADDYRFELRDGSQSGPLIYSSLSSTPSLELNSLPEGQMSWGVQGLSTSANSQVAYRSFRIDLSPPSMPSLLLPINNANVLGPNIQFQWNSGIDAISMVTDSLYITDINSSSLYNILPVGNSHTETLPPGFYEWYVVSSDEVGFRTSSPLRLFEVQ